jgi:protein-disulfide isomerase
VEVGYDPARVKGSPSAPVTMVEFADFQCPFCGRIEPTLNELLSKYDGKVQLAYRDFPLSHIHPYAQKAAEASRCAGEQGKFWDYHGLLFANQAKLDNQSLLLHARSLKLDEKKFEDCLSSGKYAAAVAKDLEEGRQAGVSGTPAFFINGLFLSGAVLPENFSRLIDDELARTGASDREHATGYPTIWCGG